MAATPFIQRLTAPWSSGADENKRSISADVLVFLAVMILLWTVIEVGAGAVKPFDPNHAATSVSTNPTHLPYYAARSLLRMFVALFFSFIFTFIVGKAAATSKRAALVILPALDILQSVPILGFLSITLTMWLALFPGSMLGVECASIFAIFTSQAWNMTFCFHQALIGTPKELDEASRLIGLSRWQRFWKLDVPGSMIPLTWNAMMSFGGGWFFLTASEVISVNNHVYALPGIGSYVAAASDRGQHGRILLAVITMIIVIILVDVLFWRPMVTWAQKFRLGGSNSAIAESSMVLSLLRRSRLPKLIDVIITPIANLLDRIATAVEPGRPKTKEPNQKRTAGDTFFIAVVSVLIGFATEKMLKRVHTTVGLDEFLHAGWLGVLTGLRVAAILVLATLIWVPIGVWIGMNPRVRTLAQPIVQVAASFPANFLFPIIVTLFISWHISLDWGGILLMALGAQWYILFNVIAGASAIPTDLREAATDMGLSRWQRWRNLIIPAILPTWVVGALTAAGGAWNASIVAEVVSAGKTTLVADGLGAYITQATTSGNMTKVLVGVSVMSLFIVGANRLIWRRLSKIAETRFSLSSA